jgi:hypothetical protein
MNANDATAIASPTPPETQVMPIVPGELTSDAASSRLQKDGPNAMPDMSGRPLRDA